MTDLERRFTPGQVEVRASAEKQRTIGGYAAKFNVQSRNLGGFVERIAPEAFNKSRGDGWPEVMARYNHDDNMLLGTTVARTLRLTVDNVGLNYDVDVPQARSDVYELVSRGDVAKSSFAFIVPPGGDDWSLNDLDIPLRTLLSVKLVDVAPVNTPAYLDTSTGLRSLARKVEAPLEDVRRLAEQNELRRFFKRTDGGTEAAKHDFGAAARMSLLNRQRDPWA
ncbi:HK97 family phage prohead protease [Terrabacter terrigena]|uniref:HK97 family phage prohead protease n=1 Tax=Terrabacter terrigena TaxID=574718 RepID=A0ABW3MXY5_9MICO